MDKVRFYKTKDENSYIMIMLLSKTIFASQIIHERHIKLRAELNAYEMDFDYVKEMIGNYLAVANEEMLSKFADSDIKKLIFKLHFLKNNDLDFNKLTIDIKY
ncbi:MAG: hypothetical protein ACRCXX_13790 [Cetobacterium sp.]|uniref:hypothetical protein n=1 Tax=Cetobacterium sp. TaxID=2071632 RepID=UPI003F3FE6D7